MYNQKSGEEANRTIIQKTVGKYEKLSNRCGKQSTLGNMSL